MSFVVDAVTFHHDITTEMYAMKRKKKWGKKLYPQEVSISVYDFNRVIEWKDWCSSDSNTDFQRTDYHYRLNISNVES
jgi:hypothetical protein